MRILIVEDEFNLADAIKTKLEKEKYEVDISSDGEEGLYNALTGIYDHIILDVMLPITNGFEILKEIKENNIESKVIMLTAKSELDDKLNGLKGGADDYITKPFQSYNLLPHLNALENIILSMDISNIKNVNKKEKALSLMKSVGLSKDLANRRVLKLSGGEQQRIAIARSLSYNPDIILADEPTGNLDKETEDDILKIFKDLANKENKCVIIVTHSKNVCDNVDVVYEIKKEK